jgi:hypothetical protein
MDSSFIANKIPQARPADRSAFHYGSEKPNLPQGKPAGFILQRGQKCLQNPDFHEG